MVKVALPGSHVSPQQVAGCACRKACCHLIDKLNGAHVTQPYEGSTCHVNVHGLQQRHMGQKAGLAGQVRLHDPAIMQK
jgi:hypothetical protein